MADTIDDQIRAFGVAQVMVKIKEVNEPFVKPSAALATSIPVTASKTKRVEVESVVKDLGVFFKFNKHTTDTALMATPAARSQSRGRDWYKKARSPRDATPALRYYPNLGIVLGTTDRAGLTQLQEHPRVARVVAPPILSLIRPVTTGAAAVASKADTWGLVRIGADKAHDKGITGKGVIVGHLDTGSDGTHPALKGAFHSFAEFDQMGFQVTPNPAPHDTDEHGTHTSGTIAGRSVAGRGIGVAPEALLASAIVIEGGNATARVLAGMDWIISQGARVLSMSLGFRGYTDDFMMLVEALRTRDVLPVFAVGNEGPGTSRSPGNYSNVISVGAMDQHDAVADFSSSQSFDRSLNPAVPSLVAPGVGVVSAKPGGGYQEMDGSSMATPHVAGIAALLLQKRPTATIDQVEKAIRGSAQPLRSVPRERQGFGVPDVVKALGLV